MGGLRERDVGFLGATSTRSRRSHRAFGKRLQLFGKVRLCREAYSPVRSDLPAKSVHYVSKRLDILRVKQGVHSTLLIVLAT